MKCVTDAVNTFDRVIKTFETADSVYVQREVFKSALMMGSVLFELGKKQDMTTLYLRFLHKEKFALDGVIKPILLKMKAKMEILNE